MNIQVIYYSKYGSTRQIAESIAKKLGTDNVTDIREHKAITGDLIIIGSAIFKEVAHEEIMQLLSDEQGKLKEKQVAIFVVCLSRERTTKKIDNKEGGGPVYIEKFEKALARVPFASMIFGGRMILAEMDDADRERTKEFAKRVRMPLKDVNVMSEAEVDEFAQDIKDKLNV